MADESPIGSPLSILSSDAFDAEEEQERMAAPMAMPPARKRQKVSDPKESATPPRFFHEDEEALGEISDDSDGDVPNSPGGLSRFDDDDTHEQVTVCNWDGCDAGDLGDMDILVKHIHDNHIESKGKKYPCEWSDCQRKGMAHASAYALRAHMRSHTREKPFYCELPECDRAFTRSDALAKHYRTVHETEALRPSDPIPKSMQANKASRAKEMMKTTQLPTAGPDVGVNSHKNGTEWTSSYPTELAFTAEEEARGPQELYRLLRRQILWAEEDAESLKQQCEAIEELYKREWQEREFLTRQTIQVDVEYQSNRKIVQTGLGDAMTFPDSKAIADRILTNAYSPPNIASSPSPMPFRQPAEDARETAAILATMQHA